MNAHKSDRSHLLQVLLCIAALALTPAAICQEPAKAAQSQAPNDAKPAKHKHSPTDDFLIHGTVFTDKALAFPGSEVRIRRASEKRFRWQEVTNSRGNFAFRVPQNASYEVLTRAKGFREQSRTIEAKPGLIEESVVFRMERLGGKK